MEYSHDLDRGHVMVGSGMKRTRVPTQATLTRTHHDPIQTAMDFLTRLGGLFDHSRTFIDRS